MLLVTGGVLASFCSPPFGVPFWEHKDLLLALVSGHDCPCLRWFGGVFATVLTLGSSTPACAGVAWPDRVLCSHSLLLFLASQPAIALQA
jgi:hypothetical protein